MLVLFAAAQIAAAAAAQPVPGPAIYNGRLGQTTVAPPKIEAEITVDGALDEPVWREAALLTGFSLYQPADGRPAPDSTDVLVWYSSSAIYFGIRAYEPHAPVSATLAERDRISSDDNVELQLDTFDERDRALVFAVNPLGVQADGTKSEVGGFIPGANVMPGQDDLSADFVWQSKGHVTPWGYEVEVRIPFSSLRYPERAVQRWGLQVDRHVQHSGYEETWTPARRASASFISQAGYLVDLHGMHHGAVVEVNPELTNTVTGAPSGSCCEAPPGWGYTSHPRLGGNLRWTLGSNFVLNGTVKPDFSQVEADATQIAADERFALFYPEKRPFFVEGQDAFNVPNTLVYTRTIVQPSAAAKLTGKLGRADVAVLSAVDQAAPAFGGDHPLVDIVRVAQAFGEQSQAGILYSDRVGGPRANRVFGGDTHIVFGGEYYAEFQAVESTTRDTATHADGPMWEAVLDGTGRSFGFHYSILGISPSFQDDNGFLQRTGFVQPGIMNRYTWYGAPGAWLERFNTYFQIQGLWKYDDFFATKSLLEDHVNPRMQFTLRGGWNISVSPTLSSYGLRPADYATLSTAPNAPYVPPNRIETMVSGFSVSTPLFPKWDASIGTTVGNDIDFLEAARVRRVDYNASLNLRPSERLRIGATYLASTFARRTDGERSTFTYIPRLAVDYQLARPLFVRVISQYTATHREPLRDPYTGEVLLVSEDSTLVPSSLSAANTLRTDWLVSYRPTPGTVFFLGYGAGMSEPQALAFQRLRRTTDGFFVKLSYAFRTVSGS